MNISVVGLGKLGSPMVACFAAKGHRVVGVDLNERFVQQINDRQAPVFEPGLADLLAQCGDRLTATTDLLAAVRDTDITFVIVPTPSESTGGFSLKYALSACKTIGQALKSKKDYHVVVMTSTVMPGATGGPIRDCLEAASGKKCPADFGLCYSPEFIALGTVIRDFLNPDLLLIGESDLRAGDRLVEVYRSVYDKQPAVSRMNFANAELTKLAVNTFVTTKISYANMIAAICERIEGGNVDEVTTALGRDSRIGSKYLKGGLGYGGPCFPRDNAAIAALARELGVPADLPEATDTINQTQVTRLRDMVHAALPPGGRVGILGLSYKPDTNVTERAQGLELAQALLADGVEVSVYDRCAAEPCKAALAGQVQFADSPVACAREADVLVVTTPSAEFKAIGASDLMRKQGRATVIDCWRLLDRIRLSAVCQYVAVGTCDVQQLEIGGAGKVLPLDRGRAAA